MIAGLVIRRYFCGDQPLSNRYQIQSTGWVIKAGFRYQATLITTESRDR
jgi:hypothetical protein